VTSGTLIVGMLAGVLAMVTALLLGELSSECDDLLSSDVVTTTACAGAISGWGAGELIAANAGTPKPTTAIPAVVQMIEFFMGVSFELM
jgi:hypothetical protein